MTEDSTQSRAKIGMKRIFPGDILSFGRLIINCPIVRRNLLSEQFCWYFKLLPRCIAAEFNPVIACIFYSYLLSVRVICNYGGRVFLGQFHYSI
jgi:hypothetical protein